MISKYLSTALLTTALMSGLASAQTGTTKTDANNASTTMHTEVEWRASKLVGVNVYNEANEKLGDVNKEATGERGGRKSESDFGGSNLGNEDFLKLC